MKKLLTLSFLVILSFSVSLAQNSGEIMYKEVLNTKPDLKQAEKQGWAQWASAIPDSMVFKKKLVFSNSESYYTFFDEGSNDGEHHYRRMWTRRYAKADNETYRNISDKKFIDRRDFMGKIFLIEGDLKKTPWKITGEIKQILGYSCIKATYTDSIGSTDAWFTTQIPISVGPEMFGGLPGAILEIKSDEHKKTLTAVKVDLRDLKEDEIVKPKKGKRVTHTEFRQIQIEKMKEMREMYKNKRGRGGHYVHH